MILIAAAVTLAQFSPLPNSDAEAILRMRDQQRRARTEQQPTQAPSPPGDAEALTGVVPPVIAARLSECLAKANIKAEDGIADAQNWASQGGGAYAAQCRGFALGRAERWAEATSAFESGAAASGIDLVTRARLFAQAGNAALIGGESARALRNLDAALAQTLPRTLSTGEIHLDRARARVATGDNRGARADLDQAVVLAQADPLSWLLSATLARRMNDLPLARLHIEEAAKRAINDAGIALEQGVIYALSGDRDPAAQASFKRAQELAAPGSDVAKQAADYLEQLGVEPVTKEVEPGR